MISAEKKREHAKKLARYFNAVIGKGESVMKPDDLLTGKCDGFFEALDLLSKDHTVYRLSEEAEQEHKRYVDMVAEQFVNDAKRKEVYRKLCGGILSFALNLHFFWEVEYGRGENPNDEISLETYRDARTWWLKSLEDRVVPVPDSLSDDEEAMKILEEDNGGKYINYDLRSGEFEKVPSQHDQARA
jgi:hypothetical protein